MQQLIDALPEAKEAEYLLDTCFVLYELDRGHTKRLEELCRERPVAMTSFNLAELEHVSHRLDGTRNHRLRDFLKRARLGRVDVAVAPGDWDGERSYVSAIDPHILELVPDASDAVLFAAAVRIGASVLTRDRHHVFTAAAENYANSHSISVLNTFPD